jgi:Helix-turn-helix domain
MKSVRPYATKAEASRISGLSRQSIYDLIRAGLLPVDENGRIRRSSLIALITGGDK